MANRFIKNMLVGAASYVAVMIVGQLTGKVEV